MKKVKIYLDINNTNLIPILLSFVVIGWWTLLLLIRIERE
jgi:hypothetical protein